MKNQNLKGSIRKTTSHGRIAEAAVAAKCWMHGIAVHNTGGLRANFAGSDLIMDTPDLRIKRLIQVKSGYCKSNKVYLTQCKGECDLADDKFHSDFVVFVNIDEKVGKTHDHNGQLSFEHLTFYVTPAEVANRLYRTAVQAEHARPLRNGGVRSLANLAVYVSPEQMAPFRNAWRLLRQAGLPKVAGSSGTSASLPINSLPH